MFVHDDSQRYCLGWVNLELQAATPEMLGSAVWIRANLHACMCMRGIKIGGNADTEDMHIRLPTCSTPVCQQVSSKIFRGGIAVLTSRAAAIQNKASLSGFISLKLLVVANTDRHVWLLCRDRNVQMHKARPDWSPETPG